MVLYLGISLLANIFLWMVVIKCWKYNATIDSAYDTKFYVLTTVAVLCACGAFYIYSICARNTIYAMDFATYFTLQSRQLEGFKLDWLEQIKVIIKSVWYDDYNSFMCVFGGIWFALSPIKNVEAYIFEVFLWAIVPTVFLIANFIRYIIVLLNTKRPKTVFGVALPAVCVFPLFHASLLQGMPDVFGVFWVFAIINLAYAYDMRKIEWDKNILLVICSIALFITRRWYAFWVVGFYISFVLLKILRGIREEKSYKVYLKAIITLAISGGATACVCLFPMFQRILSNNYAKNYSAYKKGGMLWEAGNQLEYIGIIFAILMLIGLVIGIYKKTLRFMTLTLSVTWILVVFLFTRIQNAGFHQSLLFFATYAYLIMVAIAGIDAISHRKTRMACNILVLLFVGINWGQATIEMNNFGLFTNLSLKPPIREDAGEIKEVTQYIKDELLQDSETLIYIVPHNTAYNPTVFRNANTPGELQTNIPYGAGVLGAHKFPVEFLEAQYIMTSDPSGENENKETIVNSLNDCLDYLIENEKVKEIKKFVFQEDIQFIFYEKVDKLTLADIEAFEKYFLELSKEYPELYQGVLEQYKENLE